MVSQKFVKFMLRALQRREVREGLTAENLTSCASLRGNANLEKVQNGITGKRQFSTSRSDASCLSQTKQVTARVLNPHQELESAPNSQTQNSNQQTYKLVSSIAKKFQRYLASFATEKKENLDASAEVKPYLSIPGPKGLPLLGSALQYTALGKFSPKEYHKALEYNHKK